MNEITEKEYQQIKGIAYKVYRRSFSGVEFDDLFQEGLLAYLDMKKKYKKEKNDYFMGFAYKRIYGAMLDWIGKNAINKGDAVRKRKKSRTIVFNSVEDVNSSVSNYMEDTTDFIILTEDILNILENYAEYELFIIRELFCNNNSITKLVSKGFNKKAIIGVRDSFIKQLQKVV